MRFSSRQFLTCALCLMSLSHVFGAVVHDEASMGDLSDDNTEPTPVAFFVADPGSTVVNTVIGVTEGGENGLGIPDIFTFEIANGNVLQNITLAEYSGGDPAMFVAISRGNQFPSSFEDLATGNPDTSEWLGGVIVGDANFILGNNDQILQILGENVTGAGTGFVAPLGPGNYSFYIQQTGPPNTYTLDFHVANVSAVPEPSTTFACGLMLLVGLGYRRTKKAVQRKPYKERSEQAKGCEKADVCE